MLGETTIALISILIVEEAICLMAYASAKDGELTQKIARTTGIAILVGLVALLLVATAEIGGLLP